MRAGLRVRDMAEGITGVSGAVFQTRPLYTGKPWFLGAAVSRHKIRDRLNL